MATPTNYRFRFAPTSVGSFGGSNTLKQGVSKAEGIPHDVTMRMSSAQIQGVMGYLALIKAGVDTSTVETAITALAP